MRNSLSSDIGDSGQVARTSGPTLESVEDRASQTIEQARGLESALEAILQDLGSGGAQEGRSENPQRAAVIGRIYDLQGEGLATIENCKALAHELRRQLFSTPMNKVAPGRAA